MVLGKQKGATKSMFIDICCVKRKSFDLEKCVQHGTRKAGGWFQIKLFVMIDAAYNVASVDLAKCVQHE